MGLNKRLKMYVKDNRPLKLKSYVVSHEVSTRKIRLRHGRTLLHYCAEHGSPEMLRCLLKLGCDPGHQDKAGMLPLHTSLYRALREDLNHARETYIEMVCPLLESYPMAQDVEDLNMKTGQDLLTSLKQKLKSGARADEHIHDEADERVREQEWKEKLMQEYQFEMEERESRYNLNADLSEEDSKETHLEWADRIRRAHGAKQRMKSSFNSQGHSQNSRRHAGDVSAGSSRSHKNDNFNSSGNRKRRFGPQRYEETYENMEEDEKLKQAREELRRRYKAPPIETPIEKLLSKKKMYEAKFSRFAVHVPSSGKSITYGAVPWPGSHIDQLVDVLFCDLKDKGSPQFKKYLKIQKIQWHPDKFSQKFGHHLHPDHVEKIMARVNTISQTLNALSS